MRVQGQTLLDLIFKVRGNYAQAQREVIENLENSSCICVRRIRWFLKLKPKLRRESMCNPEEERHMSRGLEQIFVGMFQILCEGFEITLSDLLRFCFDWFPHLTMNLEVSVVL